MIPSETARAPRGSGSSPSERLQFGEFELLADQATLLRQGKRVRIGSRGFELLKLLAATPGHYVGNDALIAAAWPDTVVEDTNLRVQMATLRRLLDEGRTDGSYVANAPGRGYALIIPSAPADKVWERAKPVERDGPLGLALSVTPLIGRQDVVATLLERLEHRKLVSIVGPGGIGKTRVAVEVCWRLAAAAQQQVVFVDLAPLGSGEFVASALATTMELDDTTAANPLTGIIAALRQGQCILVFDNCEHVLDATAELAELLLRAVPDLRILTTTREPLLVNGEVTVRLAGLSGPDGTVRLTSIEDALEYPAFELFVDRATAANDSLQFAESDIGLVTAICQRLDGIPLAIELAAARAGSLGIAELSRLLDHQFAVLSEGRRTAIPRQRTLWATLDWSFEGLRAHEQSLLVQLAVFRSSFSMDGAQAIAALAPSDTVHLLSNLVSKSLVVVDHAGPLVRYRLLETTRAYAEERLAGSAENLTTRRRHAEHMLTTFPGGTGGRTFRTSIDRLDVFRRQVDDVRSAIAWSLGPDGDAHIGVRLIIASAPMWLRLAILSEYAQIISDAAARLLQDPDIDPRDAMWLAPHLHNAQYNAIGLSDDIAPMLARTLEMAEQHDDTACQLNCLWPLFGTRLTQARYDEALEYANRFAAIADQGSDPLQQAMGHRIVALSLWRRGDLAGAVSHARTALAPVDADAASPINLTLIYKQGVAARANFSNLLWLQGDTSGALALAEEAVEVGLESDVVGLCYAMAHTIVPLAFWMGDLNRAERLIGLLLRLAKENELGLWLFWGRTYEGALHRLRHGASDKDFIGLNAGKLGGLHGQILVTVLGESPGLTNDIAAGDDHWCAAELMRRRAQTLAAADDRKAARELLEQALALARRQHAVAWERRAIDSLKTLAI